MGISVIMQPSVATSATQTASPIALTSDGNLLPFDFAALLTEQLPGLNLPASLPGAAVPAPTVSADTGTGTGVGTGKTHLSVQDFSDLLNPAAPSKGKPVTPADLPLEKPASLPHEKQAEAASGAGKASRQDSDNPPPAEPTLENAPPLLVTLLQAARSPHSTAEENPRDRMRKDDKPVAISDAGTAPEFMLATPTPDIQNRSVPTPVVQLDVSAPRAASPEAVGPNTAPANLAASDVVNKNWDNLALSVVHQPANESGTSPSPTEAANSPRVAPPLHDRNWAPQFSESVVWLAKNEQHSAQININPPNLGPVQVTINLNGDQASAVFASPHAEVRQAIQDALPQLREMLANSGINLGQSDVGAQFAHREREFTPQFANENRTDREDAILHADNPATSATMTVSAVHRGRGLVDLFA